VDTCTEGGRRRPEKIGLFSFSWLLAGSLAADKKVFPDYLGWLRQSANLFMT